jgi:GT2 family glycosyltransferase
MARGDENRTEKHPRVSFVIPVYNVENTVGETLKTVLDQDWPADRMEVIVVDNGSTDKTVDVIGRFPVELVFDTKRGRSAPRNRGVSAASPDSSLIASVDADVELPRDFLRSLTSAMERNWIGAAQAAVMRVRREGREEPSEDYKLAHYYMPFLDTCAMVFRREAFDAAGGFDEELVRHVDMDFSFRLLACGYAFAWVPQTVVTKHHELGYIQAFQRGWESGLASYQLNTKWRRRLHRSMLGLAIDRVKSWTLPLARQVLALQPTAPILAFELAGRFVSYAYHRAVSMPKTTRLSFEPRTRLPAVLGPDRYLLFQGSRCSIYDAPAQRIAYLNDTDTSTLKAIIDGGAPEDGVELGRRLGMPFPDESTAMIRREQCR